MPQPLVENDYRPVALTSVPLKYMEKLVLSELVKQTAHMMDPLQFAYRKSRGTEDATSLLIH